MPAFAAPGAGYGGAPAPVTARQLRIIEHLGAGLSIRQIAAQLEVARGTVRDDIEDAGGKLGVRGSAALVAAAVRHHLLTPEPAETEGGLDPWERRVVALVAGGGTEKSIARETGKRQSRIRGVIGTLYTRLDARTHAQLVYRAAALGAYPEPDEVAP